MIDWKSVFVKSIQFKLFKKIELICGQFPGIARNESISQLVHLGSLFEFYNLQNILRDIDLIYTNSEMNC